MSTQEEQVNAHLAAKREAPNVTATVPDARTHGGELLASHPGRPTPAEAVGRGVTPSSGG